MKKSLLFSFLCLIAGFIYSQERDFEFSSPQHSYTQSSNLTSLTEAREIAEEILKVTNRKANFTLRSSSSVPNAAAVVYGSKRYVLYNPGFFQKLKRATGTPWAAVSVLAHAIGHHLALRKNQSNLLATELEADEFSGFALAKLGATLAEAQAAMKVLGTARATRTHPASRDRLAYIKRGYENGGGKKDAMIAKKPRRDPEELRELVLPDKYVLADIVFNADPQTKYFLTTRGNIVKFADNKILQVGTMAKSGDDDFPFVMKDARNVKLYVSTAGSIINASGKRVGKMKVK